MRKFAGAAPAPRTPGEAEVGLRTTRADEMWHIDTTVIRLLDGTRAYLHAVIDNFSRRILTSRRVGESFAPVNSVIVLVDTSGAATPSETTPVVLADSGVESVNIDGSSSTRWTASARSVDGSSSTCTNTTVCFRTPRFAARRLTRCTSARGDAVPANLTSRAAAARRARVEAERSAACQTCPSSSRPPDHRELTRFRFVRTIKESRLDRLILVGEGSFS